MKLKLFPTCAFLSLALGAGTIWWWTSSKRHIDQLAYERPGTHAVRLWGSDGRVLLTRAVYSSPQRTPVRQVTWSSIPAVADAKGSPTGLTWASFAYDKQPMKEADGVESTLVVPAWLLAAAFMVPPMAWLALRMKPKKKPSSS